MSGHDYGRLSDAEIKREWQAAKRRAEREQADIDAAAEKSRRALAEQDNNPEK